MKDSTFVENTETALHENQLTQEEQLFLNILKDYLNGVPGKLPESVCWRDLMDIARKHEASGILYYQLKRELDGSDIGANQKVKLFKSYADISYRYDKRQKLLSEIDREFDRNHIAYFIFKGIDIAELYPNPKLRSMGDSDILVHKKDANKANICLMNLGCAIDGMGDIEWHYHREDIRLELHRKLMVYQAASSKKQTAFYSRCWDYAVAEPNSVHCHLDWSYHFVYVITHLRKHFIFSGVGFRQFMDISVMAKKCTLDWSWIQKELTAMDMWEFARCCFAFCKKWFEVEFPVRTDEIDGDFYLEATKRIFAGGVFGAEDKRNLSNEAIFRMRKRKEKKTFSEWWSDFVQILRLPFPPYNSLRYWSEYAFINHRPYLLPIAWIKRAIGYCIRRCKDKSLDLISDEQLEKQNKMMDSWKI